MSTPALEASAGAVNANVVTQAVRAVDPFAPPYNENLYVGDLKDEYSGEEYAVLVRLIPVFESHLSRLIVNLR